MAAGEERVNVTFLPPPLTIEMEAHEAGDNIVDNMADKMADNIADNLADSGGGVYRDRGDSGADTGALTDNELDQEDFQGPHSWRKKLRPTGKQQQQAGSGNSSPQKLTPRQAGSEGEELDLRIAIGLDSSSLSASTDPSPRSAERETDSERINRLGKEGKLDNSKIREKLKHIQVLRKESMERKTKGPLLARPSQQYQNLNLSPKVSKRRVPSHLQPPTESAFTRQIVNGTNPASSSSASPRLDSPGPQRKARSSSHASSTAAAAAAAMNPATKIPVPSTALATATVQQQRGGGGGGGGGGGHTSAPYLRQPSPRDVDNQQSREALKKRILKVMKARLYLLQPSGPNSFLIGGDSPSHKYRVIIGPQRCSCGGRSQHCVHVLFVMLRVFQLPENDPMIWSKTLKNFEVESLFKTFHARRTSRIHDLKRKKSTSAGDAGAVEGENKENQPQHTQQAGQGDNNTSEKQLSKESGAVEQANPGGGGDGRGAESEEEEEEETCPICLLEMVEGESITECAIGCKNRLHHHCIDVWFAECRQQAEPLTCPLCRHAWAHPQAHDSHDAHAASAQQQAPPPEVPPNTRASSPLPQSAETDVRLPVAEPIAQEYRDTAEEWIPVFGEELVGCLFSKNWHAREVGLRRVGQVTSGRLWLGVGVGRAGSQVSPARRADTLAVLRCAARVLAVMCADPVYKVFVAALKTLRVVLSFTSCRDEAQQAWLQELISPVVHTILWKSADSNKRTSQLSISTLQELMKGQQGELAVGREIHNPGSLGLGGVSYLCSCITSNYDPVTVQWQWLLGRFYMLDRIVEDHPAEFIVHREPIRESGRSMSRNVSGNASGNASQMNMSEPGTNMSECGGTMNELRNMSETGNMSPFVRNMSESGMSMSEAESAGNTSESMPEPMPEARNYRRVMSVLHFTTPALDHGHTKVGKCARRLFCVLARLQTHNEAVFKEVGELLTDLAPNVRHTMRRRLARMADEHNMRRKKAEKEEEAAAEEEEGRGSGEEEEDGTPLVFSTPTMSATSTPRCNSPVSVMAAAAGAPGLSFPLAHRAHPPEAPPNSPARPRQATHATQTDSESMSGGERGEEASEEASEGTSDVESGLFTPATTPAKRALHVALAAEQEPEEPDEAEGTEEIGTDMDAESDSDKLHCDNEDNKDKDEVDGNKSQALSQPAELHTDKKTMVDASVETSPQLRGLRRMRPVLHFKGPHPHPKVHFRSPSTSATESPATAPAELAAAAAGGGALRFMVEPTYDCPVPEDPLNTSAASYELEGEAGAGAGLEGEELGHEVGTSTHEVLPSDENGDLGGAMSYVADPTQVELHLSHDHLADVSREAVADDDDEHNISSTEHNLSSNEEHNLSSIHSSKEHLTDDHAIHSHGSVADDDGAEDDGVEDDAAEDDDSGSISSLHAAATSTAGNLTDDFSDLMSPELTADDRVSFKTEVASSPQHASPAGSSEGEHCYCKEEVEMEEAKAVVAALEKSQLEQTRLPYVPGLSQQHQDATMTIRVQDETMTENWTGGSGRGSSGGGGSPQRYLEEHEWRRGPMIGTGAFSTCYQARDTRTGTLMCVKQISFCRNSVQEQERVVASVREEIEMMSKLNHPNIVRILGATQQGCHFFMFVEWMPGGAVSTLLDRYGAFQESVIVSYSQQVLHGLSYLHDNHVLHRDLKGANLLVDSTGQRVRIGDFGASARLASRQTAAGEFQGQLLGTIAFMAPEVLRGENYGRSCDMWSVGCTVIEMITTKPPWGANDISNHLALIFKIASASEPPPIPEHISPALRDLLLRCLEVKRDERPPARELLKHPLFTMRPTSR